MPPVSSRQTRLFKHLKPNHPVGLGDLVPFCPLAFVWGGEGCGGRGFWVEKPRRNIHPPREAPRSRHGRPVGLTTAQSLWSSRAPGLGLAEMTPPGRDNRGTGQAPGCHGKVVRLIVKEPILVHLCNLSIPWLRATALTSLGPLCLHLERERVALGQQLLPFSSQRSPSRTLSQETECLRRFVSSRHPPFIK